MIAMVTASQWAFWLLAPIMVLAALGMVFSRRVVHSALCLAAVMICLAVQYAAQEAPFLFVVQIIVYTGAILMLFLFVVMMIGKDVKESTAEVLKGHRTASILVAVLLAVMLVVAVGNAVTAGQLGIGDTGLAKANTEAGNNVNSLADLLFSRYVIPFEATSALLITAAVGAMVLAHGERLHPKKGQRARVAERMKAYADTGAHPGPKPNSGVFARSNAIGAPALLPDGSVAEESISTALRSRGGIIDAGELKAPTERAFAAVSAARAEAEGELE